MTDLLVSMLVRLWLVRALERPVLRSLRLLRRLPGGKGIWWRFRRDTAAAVLSSKLPLRWTPIPGGGMVLLNVVGLYADLYFEGTAYEPATTAFFLEHATRGATVVDIGANLGYFAVMAARSVGPEGAVVAFEANPAVRESLARSVERLGQQAHVRLPPIALSSSDTDAVDFFVSNDPCNSGISSMRPWSGHLESGRLSDQNQIRVPARRFDSWLQEHPLSQIDILKVDVEGAEMLVFNGMEGTLASMPPRYIICETGPHGDVAQLLESLGYTSRMLDVYDAASGWGNVLFEKTGD